MGEEAGQTRWERGLDVRAVDRQGRDGPGSEEREKCSRVVCEPWAVRCKGKAAAE